MSRRTTVVVVLLAVVMAAWGQGIDAYDGTWLSGLSIREADLFMKGFIAGVYASTLLANQVFGLPAPAALALMIRDESSMDVLRDTTGWYLRTTAFSTPLYIVIYRRHLD